MLTMMMTRHLYIFESGIYQQKKKFHLPKLKALEILAPYQPVVTPDFTNQI